MANILDQQNDPRQDAQGQRRPVRLGTPRRENETTNNATGEQLSQPPLAGIPDLPTTNPLPAPTVPTEPLREVVFDQNDPEGRVVAPGSSVETPLDPSTPPPPQSEPDAPQPIELPDFSAPLPFESVRGGEVTEGNEAFMSRFNASALRNSANWHGTLNELTNRPSPFRAYAEPPQTPDASGAIRQRQSYVDWYNEQLAKLEQQNLTVRPGGTSGLYGTSNDILRALPTLDPTRSIYNQMAGGGIGRGAEVPNDQRWFSLPVAEQLGMYFGRGIEQFFRGDFVSYLNPVTYARAGARYISERMRAGERDGLSVANILRAAQAEQAGMQPQRNASNQPPTILQRMGDLVQYINQEAFRGMSPQAQARSRAREQAGRDALNMVLQGWLPQEDPNSPTGFRMDWRRGYFGEMGGGVLGAGLYALNAVGSAVPVIAYTVGDALIEVGDNVTGQQLTPTINAAVRALVDNIPAFMRNENQTPITPVQIRNDPGYDPFYRARQVLSGIDLGFMNVMGANNNRYLSVTAPSGFSTPVRVTTGAIGFGLDVVTGGWSDNIAGAASRSVRRYAIAAGRTAQREGLIQAMNAPRLTRTVRALNRMYDARRAADARRGIVSFASNEEFPEIVSPSAPVPTPVPGAALSYETAMQNLNTAPISPRTVIQTRQSVSTQQLAQQLLPDIPFETRYPGQRLLPPAAEPGSRAIVPTRVTSAQEVDAVARRFNDAQRGVVGAETPNGIETVVLTDVAPRSSTAQNSIIVRPPGQPGVIEGREFIQARPIERRITRYVEDLWDGADGEAVIDAEIIRRPDGTDRFRVQRPQLRANYGQVDDPWDAPTIDRELQEFNQRQLQGRESLALPAEGQTGRTPDGAIPMPGGSPIQTTAAELEQLFLEADRIGSKYQTPEEIRAFNQRYAEVVDDINAIIDQADMSSVPSQGGKIDGSVSPQRPTATLNETERANVQRVLGVTADRIRRQADQLVERGRNIPDAIATSVYKVEPGATEAVLNGVEYNKVGRIWVRQGDDVPTTILPQPTAAPRHPITQLLEEAPTVPTSRRSLVETVAAAVDDIPNNTAARTLANEAPVRPAILEEAIDEGVIREADDGLLVSIPDEIAEIESYIESQKRTLQDLTARVYASTDKARRQELWKQQQAIRNNIDDANIELRNLKRALPQEVAVINAAAPILTQEAMRPSMKAAEYLNYLDSDEYVNRIGAVTAADVLPVKRSGADLSRLAKFIVDDNGRPLMNPARKSVLNKRELDKLRNAYPGVFDVFGKPVPSDLLNPNARIEVQPRTVGTPQVTQFVAPRPTMMTEADATSAVELSEAAAKAELYRDQLPLDKLRATAQRKEALIDDILNNNEFNADAVEELLQMENATSSFANAVDHPAVARSWNDTLAPNDLRVAPADIEATMEFRRAQEEFHETGTGIREMAESIGAVTDELDRTIAALDMAPELKRARNADAIATAVNYQAYDPEIPLPRHQQRLIDDAQMTELTPFDLDSRIAAQAELDELMPNAVDPMGARAARAEAWYHGTKQTQEAMFSNEYNPVRGGSSGEFGVGLYLTDRADVAEMYARAATDPTFRYPGTQRLGAPSVYRWSDVQPRSPLFLGQAARDLPDEVGRLVNDAFGGDILDDIVGATEEMRYKLRELNRQHPLLRDRWLNVREAYADTFGTPMPEGVFQDYSVAVAERLRMAGFDSLVDTSKVRGRTLTILPHSTEAPFWAISPLPPGVPSQRLAASADEGLDAVMNRHQADNLLHQSMGRRTTAVWEQESRMDTLENMLERYTKEYDDMVDQGLFASNRVEALRDQLRELNNAYIARRTEAAQQSAEAAQVRLAKDTPIDDRNPCI